MLVVDGLLTQIENQIEVEEATVIDKKDLHLSSGWFDPCVSFGEPGYEERETLANGLLYRCKKWVYPHRTQSRYPSSFRFVNRRQSSTPTVTRLNYSTTYQRFPFRGFKGRKSSSSF